jgi:hypothetical protein
MDHARTVSFQVSKLDAAVKQLRTAIRLWFAEDDPVSAHTLAYAAYTVIEDVCKSKTPARDGLLFDPQYLQEGDRELFIKVYRHSGNFFKHADRDPNAVITFSPELTRIFFNYSLYGLWLAGEQVAAEEIAIFRAWTAFTQPQFRTESERRIFSDAFLAQFTPDVRSMKKQEFFEFFAEVLPAIESLSATSPEVPATP